VRYRRRIHVENYLRKCLYGTGILIKLTEIFEKLISAAGNVKHVFKVIVLLELFKYAFMYLEMTNGDKLSKSDKQRFRFSNLFTTK